MSNFSYVAVDPGGAEIRVLLNVADQSEALRRIKEMGLFPTKVLAAREQVRGARQRVRMLPARPAWFSLPRRVKPRALTAFTRQLATLVEAGLPLLRGLRLLHEQEEDRTLKKAIGDLAMAVETGSSFAEAVSLQPRIFNNLYLNMVKAGEIGGALEVTLGRLAEFVEKAQKIKGKVKAALFYPCAVLLIASAIMAILMIYVVPKFKLVFDGLMNGIRMPAFSLFVFGISDVIRLHALASLGLVGTAIGAIILVLRTDSGRAAFDRFKLKIPLLGPVFRKVAVARFARTLGTLTENGVPILQALTIVKETAGNVLIGRIISNVHENVKQGEPMAPTLRSSGVFPVVVAGMVDVGEQTGALPEMLMKVADNYDEEVDNATSAMTSLLEPIMIVILAIIVGSIVLAMFLPIIVIMEGLGEESRS
ncbi:MAG TPA: type II secretion system F family protein [Candidatus Dormibacteraeota bacterium]|nr:type II secretion system F family protein [Candidatus Dormibacteraeota bacterium]